MTINVINIGCFKNLVDCEKLIKQLEPVCDKVVFGECNDYFDLVIINTCGFISNAENDSLAILRKYAELKKFGSIGELWVMGCYSQKRGENLRSDIPLIDRIYGNFNWYKIIDDLHGHYKETYERRITTPKHYAYLKISEGCNQSCSYCIKPILNGPLQSYDIQSLIEECKYLVSQGVKEFQIVGQNLTSYGQDLYGEKRIAELVNRIADVKGVEWIRLHYAYPLAFPMKLLDIIRERENVCNYLDMAIQHCSTKMLKLMHRAMSKERLVELITTIRERVPGIYLRTTVMTGHPGETISDFEELYEFVKQMRFERMGVFAYSHQEGTYNHRHYIDNIPRSVKEERALSLMRLQADIYKSINTLLIGTIERCIIDYRDGDYWIGRSEHSTPMADPKIYIPYSDDINVGSFYNVRITHARGKDMDGVIEM